MWVNSGMHTNSETLCNKKKEEESFNVSKFCLVANKNGTKKKKNIKFQIILLVCCLF